MLLKNMEKKINDIIFIYLASDFMSQYTLSDFEVLDNVYVVNKVNIFKGIFKDKLTRFWLANSVNCKINLPFKRVFYKSIFASLNISNHKDICIIITPAWFDKQLYAFIKQNYPKAKIVVRFGDKVDRKMKANPTIDLQFIRNHSDMVVVYDENDAKHYDFEYLPMGYSKVPESMLIKKEPFDVVFIGAAKDRLNEIKYCYNNFVKHGLSCFFYVTGVKEIDRDNSGIIYEDNGLSFKEYLSYEYSAKCILEILQANTTGRTFRMMEAIIYNKLLITNCPEILNTNYYNGNVFLFNDIKGIDFGFPNKNIENNNYNGDFSPIQLLLLINDKLYNM